jgi:alkylated DNA repair dioxygenase AlkB
MTLDLFESFPASHEDYIEIDLGDASLRYYANFMSSVEADETMRELRTRIEWRQEFISMYGAQHPIPRLSAWYGEEGVSYAYSGIEGEACLWFPELERLRARIESRTGEVFNGVLANFYRDGRDSVSWHSDDEPSLGSDPIVASLSLGSTRRFQLKHRMEQRETVSLELKHGSLLVMMSGTQKNWLHQVPKTRQVVGERINLTFRRIV